MNITREKKCKMHTLKANVIIVIRLKIGELRKNGQGQGNGNPPPQKNPTKTKHPSTPKTMPANDRYPPAFNTYFRMFVEFSMKVFINTKENS